MKNIYFKGWPSPIPFKMTLKMKLTTLLLIVSLFKIQANSYSQNTKISISHDQISIRDVFKEIENKSEFRFLYKNKEIDLKRTVSIHVTKENIYDILSRLFKGTSIKYEVLDNRQIVLTKQLSGIFKVEDDIPIAAGILQITVNGNIADSNGSPLAGANVVEKGTTNGVTADFDGNFAINLKDNNAVLVVSYIGFATKEVQINGQANLSIILEESSAGLDEVVVVGYGTTRLSEITGAVGVVTSEELTRQPAVNPLQNLRGKVAGVSVFSNSGQPGAGNNNVVIRGVGTRPLYVVDGQQTDNIDFLNPSDIESIEVLKDASSAAIYGARGANGVILVTTQSGLKYNGTMVEYSSNLSFGTLAKKRNSLYTAMNSEEFLEVQRKSYENIPLYPNYVPGSTPPVFTTNNPLLFDAQGNPLYDTNWEDETTRTAISHDHHLSIRSGSEKSSTGFFLNYTDQQGVFTNSYFKRADTKFTYNTDLNDWLSVGAILRLNYVWENEALIEGFGTDPIARTIIEYAPIFPIRFPDGTYSSSNSANLTGTGLLLESGPNPVSVLEEVDNLNDRVNFEGNTFADVHLTPDLTFRSQFGITYRTFRNRYFAPATLFGTGSPDGVARVSHSTNTFWQNENFLTYEKEIGSSRLKGVLGASWAGYSSDGFSTTVRGFDNSFFKYNNLGAGSNTQPASSNYNDWSLNSYFFRGNYTYNNKYNLTLTGRADGSSRFGGNNKYGFFPSVGADWVVSREDFLKDSKTINSLKIRASYGVVGNTDIPSYASLATVGSGTNLIGGQLRSTSYLTRLANPDLKWERTSQFNIGLDLLAFKDVLTISADYYYKLTTDLLLDRPIPSASGFESILANIGSVSNRGIDFLISSKNIETQKYSWNTSLSVNYNKNRIEALGENNEDIFPGPGFVDGSQTILRVGEPVSSFWGLERLGIYGTDEVAEAAAVGKVPGQIKRSAERKIIGNGLPDYRGSFINRFSAGQFDAIVDLQFSLGAEILQQFVTTAEDRQALTNGFKSQLVNGWTPDNQDTFIPQIRNTVLSGQDLAVDSHWVADGSYVRGNLLSLGYTFNDQILEILGFKYARFNLSLENAFVIVSDEFKGYDPEQNGLNDGSNFGQNIEFYSYPKPRTFSMGLNVKF